MLFRGKDDSLRNTCLPRLIAAALTLCLILAGPGVARPEAEYVVLEGIPQTDRPLGLRGGARVADDWFDGAVFVGDSVSLKLRNYVRKARKDAPRLLGDAQFITIGSFAARLALQQVGPDSYHPSINGVKLSVEDALAELGARKLYIMLGMNDVGISGTDGAVDDMMELLARIRARLPELEIYVQSVTPRLSGGPPRTQQLFEYDLALNDALCALGDAHMHFVDVAYVMRDESGKLPRAYCSDPNDLALHLTDSACEAWTDYLYTHTGNSGE